jgi:hypothetical protein
VKQPCYTDRWRAPTVAQLRSRCGGLSAVSYAVRQGLLHYPVGLTHTNGQEQNRRQTCPLYQTPCNSGSRSAQLPR